MSAPTATATPASAVRKRPASASADGPAPKTRTPLCATWPHGTLSRGPSGDSGRDRHGVRDAMDCIVAQLPRTGGPIKVVSAFPDSISPMPTIKHYLETKGIPIIEVATAVQTHKAGGFPLLQQLPADHVFVKLAPLTVSGMAPAVPCLLHGKSCQPDLQLIDLVVCGGDASCIEDAVPRSAAASSSDPGSRAGRSSSSGGGEGR